MKRLSILLISAICSGAYADSVTLNAQTFPNTCKMSHKCDVHAIHDIEIINETDQNHYYKYTYMLCTDGAQCVYTSSGVWVGYRSRWNNHHESNGKVTLEYTGKHSLVASTSVFGVVTEDRTDTKEITVN